MEAKTLALYLGCEAMVTYDHSEYDFKVKLVGIDHEGNPLGIYEGSEVGFGRYQTIENGKIKLLLRPLSSVTEKESSECPRLAMDKWGNATLESMAKLVNHLRSLGVDCDGLIEKGEAIDSTKL